MRAAFLVFSFLLFALAAKPLRRVAVDAAPEQVLGITGKILRTGTDYYILPVIRGRGGGLIMASTGSKTYLLDVVQDRNPVSKGLPLTFTPMNAKKVVIRVSTDLNIKFSGATICGHSTMWKLDNYDILTKQWFVTTSRVEGNPGHKTIDNWFKIEKHENQYKLVFYPTVCNHCKVKCGDIGVYIDQYRVRRLALNNVPFKVMFKKA